MRGRNWKTFAVATVATLALAACGGDTAEESEAQPEAASTPAEQPTEMAVDLPEGVTQEMYQQGRTLFTGAGSCLACHGPDATGTQLGPDLTDDTWINVSSRDFDEIVEVIKSGVPQPKEHPGPMPPKGGANITDAQVEALAAYVVGLGG